MKKVEVKQAMTDVIDMKDAKELMLSMITCSTYVTIRGTTGDGDGVMFVDQDFIDEYEYGDVIQLSELIQINEDAYNDIMGYIADNQKCFDPFNIDDYYVIINDCTYILAWD